VIFDTTIKEILNTKLGELETHLAADVVLNYGEVHSSLLHPFRDLIEELQKTSKVKRLAIILNTGGGNAL